MSKRPEGDLGSMAISKAKAASAVPFAEAPSPGYGVKSLTVKLDAGLYALLREHCFAQEKATGKRISHQDVMVAALRMLLDSDSR
jgi:hypothetical protein